VTEQYFFLKQGNVSAAVIDILRSAPEVQEFFTGDPKISTNLTGFTAGDTWITVTQHGGSQRWPKPAHPRIDLNVYADRDSTAIELIETCKGVLFREQNKYTGHGLKYISAAIETDTFKANEPNTNVARYSTAIRIVHKPRANP